MSVMSLQIGDVGDVGDSLYVPISKNPCNAISPTSPISLTTTGARPRQESRIPPRKYGDMENSSDPWDVEGEAGNDRFAPSSDIPQGGTS